MLSGTATAPILARANATDTYSGQLYSCTATFWPAFTPKDSRQFAVRLMRRSNSA